MEQEIFNDDQQDQTETDSLKHRLERTQKLLLGGELSEIHNKIENPQTKEFKKAISILKYSRKWFNRLRGCLFFGTYEDPNDALAPLSNHGHITILL